MIKLGASDLRTTKPSLEQLKKIKKNPIYIIVDNVLDTYNVGAIFRLADAVAAEKVILCGQTETPPHTRIKKASINTSEWVAWEYASTAVEAIRKLKASWNCHPAFISGSHEIPKPASPVFDVASQRGEQVRNDKHGMIIAVEQSSKSVRYDKVDYRFPIALVVGNETTGVSKEVLDIVDEIVEIPMWGVNKSLNVMVSLGIVLFEVMKKASRK